MKLSTHHDAIGGRVTYSIEFTYSDLESARMTRTDQNTLAAVSGDEGQISDRLDWLRRIARLVESSSGPKGDAE